MGTSLGLILLVAASLVFVPMVTADDHTDPPPADETVDVGTVGNWSTSEYRWVAVSVGNDSQELTSSPAN